MPKLIPFRGQKVMSTLPDELAAAQKIKTRTIKKGREVPRVRFGKEQDYADVDPGPCYCCCAKPGEFHGLDCVEECCSQCKEPADGCECTQE